MSIGPKQALFAEFAVIAPSLGSAQRLEIWSNSGRGSAELRRLPSVWA